MPGAGMFPPAMQLAPPGAGPAVPAPRLDRLVEPLPTMATIELIKDSEPHFLVYIGNIDASVDDETLRQMLAICGHVLKWHRVGKVTDSKDTAGRYRALGFAEYVTPEGASRAVRVLNNFEIGGQGVGGESEPVYTDPD